MIVGFLDLEFVTENGIATACVDKITRPDIPKVCDRKIDMFVREIDALDCGLLVDFGAIFARMIEHQFAEIAPRDLERVVSLRPIRAFEKKFNSLVTTGAENSPPYFFR